jgi:hypothetical protein
MKTKKISIDNLKTSFQVAMLGSVSQKLRAICLRKQDNIVYVNFYYDGLIDDLNQDLAEMIMTEVMSDFNYDEEGREIKFDYKILRLDYPNLMPLDGEWIYFRYEPKGEQNG